ncbi:hypothetical protein CTH30272_00139 [Allocatenococcus thiocycli]|nr:hypothetical protein CTH30272_00139 [Catenococcus thiocycli]
MKKLLLLMLLSSQSQALTLDESLDVAIKAFHLEGNVCSKTVSTEMSPLASVGELIFERPVLSGDKDISCANCHIDSKALTDGLALAIGVGGVGEDKQRLESGGAVVPRNAFTLFARADERFSVFFWDGKVQLLDDQIYSPIGEGYSMGFDSTLSVAAFLPLLARDEFLGHSAPYKNNRHVELVENQYFHDKVQAQNVFVQERLQDQDDTDVRLLVDALKRASLSNQELTLPVIGNALASFIKHKTNSTCKPSPWEKYIVGDKSALSKDQKLGALVFYGKGRCAACHSGDLLSDMKFHSIGVPQGPQGPHMFGQDLGRAMVTHQTQDRYQFRTPSLVSVSNTAPYGHNGMFPSLEEMVKYHISPIFYFRKADIEDSMILRNNETIASRSDVLRWIRVSETELENLLKFLEAL